MANVSETLWIPAFAGMTGAKTKSKTYPCKPVKGEGIRCPLFVLDFGWRACPRFREDDVAGLWIPAFAGMTGAKTNLETCPYKPIKGEGIR